MESLRIIPDLTQTGLREGEHTVAPHEGDVAIGGMPQGTESGRPSVVIAFELEEGFLVAETTLALFLTAADVLKAKYGDPR
jgi:hypothetical protein